MKTDRIKFIDYDFRPETYWELNEPAIEALRNDRADGDATMALAAIETGVHGDVKLRKEALDDIERNFLRDFCPRVNQNCYPDDHEPGEVVIAWIEVNSDAEDQLTVRTKRVGEKIQYRVVDYYWRDVDFSPRESLLPLTLGELVDLIDGAQLEDCKHRGLGLCFTIENYEREKRAPSEDLLEFTKVHSIFYSQLKTHYCHAALRWLDSVLPRKKQRKKTVPPGMVKCDVCGEYRGTAKIGELSWDDHIKVFGTPIRIPERDPEEVRSASCLCQGSLCRRCNKNKVHRSGTNSYCPEANTIEHWPWFSNMIPCGECRAKEKQEKAGAERR